MTHLKTLAAPRSMKIPRRGKVFILTPSPGPHAKSECVSMGTLLREYLGLAENRKEIKHILNTKQVLVDGRRVKSEDYPLGLFDVVSILEIEKDYLMLVDHHGRLYAKEINKKAAEHKMCKLVNKTMIKGNKLQLNFYDGKNLLVDAKDSKKYAVGGTAVLKLPELKITDFLLAEPGKTVIVAKGRHASKMGKIVSKTGSDLNLSSLTTLDCSGEKVITNTAYIYVISEKLYDLGTKL